MNKPFLNVDIYVNIKKWAMNKQGMYSGTRNDWLENYLGTILLEYDVS